MAVAVGLTPEMLPVIVTTTLARGASRLARTSGVIVKRLPALHDLGAVDVLCLDKTGTLTEDRPVVAGSTDGTDRPDPDVLRWAAISALWTLQLAELPAADALDEAVLDAAEECGPSAAGEVDPDAYEGVAVVPFDPVRRVATAVVTPAHKARIVSALRARGHTTGFLGDGVNDLHALHAADVGICPRNAVDVAREAADVVLAEKDLTAIDRAVLAGRRSSGNIATYLRITLSSDLGNVIAMLTAGLMLPFLPMLPAQVLVQNLCFDAAQLAFAFDRPAASALRRPTVLRPRDSCASSRVSACSTRPPTSPPSGCSRSPSTTRPGTAVRRRSTPGGSRRTCSPRPS
ncbi:Magnesium-transporting ATPase, P-type 1 [Streptomyces sp. ADI98-10]|nr:Magnesium-transporting ATPase, P-type 1 [Streptomyces sp. ADI98-10]